MLKHFDSREAAHAPSYTISWGFNKYYKNVSFGADLISKDKFYYDDSHNEQSKPYTLVNLNVVYQINSDQIFQFGQTIFLIPHMQLEVFILVKNLLYMMINYI